MNIDTEMLLNKAINIVLALMFALIAKKLAAIVIDKYFNQVYKTAQTRGRSINKKRLHTLARAFKSMANVGIWLMFIVVVLGIFNVRLAPLLTGAGATAIIFGIAGKDIIMDLYVGFMALIEDQYRVGDEIEISKDHEGIVEEITLRTVKLRGSDGSVHIIPHSMARSIINKTYDYSLVNIEMSIGYSSDTEKIKEIVDSVGNELHDDSRWGKIFVEPISFYSMLSFDKEELTFKAQGKVKPNKQAAAESEFRLRVTDAFEEAGIVTQPIVEIDDSISKKPNKKAKSS